MHQVLISFFHLRHKNKKPGGPLVDHNLSVQNRDSLARLSEEFTPTDVKFLLSPHVDSSLEDCRAAAKGMIERVKKAVENNFSAENAGLKRGRGQRFPF